MRTDGEQIKGGQVAERASQQIFRVRREYNIWVGNQTLEDYALRFTAKSARRRSIRDVGLTALGATAFLALEAIAATITLAYGFSNFLAAMLAVGAVLFVTSFPIGYYAARHGLDIDLLTRGAGFGYLGSTITSLIYASFTFIFFAIEAAIMASALQALLGIPLAWGYVICALLVLPIVTHGITAISRFQIGTQPVWLLLQCLALFLVAWHEFAQVDDWTRYAPEGLYSARGFDLMLFGGAASILFAMVAQIGEQADYLRFMPPKTEENRVRWWFWVVLAGPGWVFIGLLKMLLGSFLAWLALERGLPAEQAVDPTRMYQMVFNYLTQSPSLSLVLAGLMVVISQMKINVTNAYAGSIAWSNFFSRLTHSHPGRVVWLVFNVAIALILMELGIYRALENILGVFAIVALSWLGSLSADLMINKPLGLSPAMVEFKRAHLYDVNPVGVGSMLLASVVGIACYLGAFGDAARYLAHFISLALCFVCVPAIACWTKGRYYLARQSPELTNGLSLRAVPAQATPAVLECCICENAFEGEDLSHCPAYQGPICSLCCSLDSRCLDSCKSGARFSEQLSALLQPRFPLLARKVLESRLLQYLALLSLSSVLLALLLGLVYFQMRPQGLAGLDLLRSSLLSLYFILLIVCGVIAWLFLLAHESRVVAQQESNRQTQLLMQEIEAHNETDQALQRAKELAERANSAKSRYLTGISHELRTPLQSILGYAQLLGQREDMPVQHLGPLQIIRRSGEYLADLIEGLLDISKIEAGRLDIYRNQVNLPQLFEQLADMFREQARQKGLHFEVHLHDRLPACVTTDEKRLRQILINLLSNAIKYTSQGRVDFHVRYRNQVAEFSVEDSGIGIHAEDLQRILQPFERVRHPDHPHIPGTGLGLTIVRLLVEIMGGELRIDSTPGQGSRFSVSLMFSWVDKPGEAAAPSRRISGYHRPARSVLVVDDEALHRGLMVDLLTPLGFKVLEAAEARAALEIAGTARPDIFLLDMSLPGRSGMELAEELRRLGHEQPIVMVSADAQERHRSPHEAAFHDDYLVKPINTQTLLERMGQLLGLRWRFADETETQTRPEAPPVLPAANDCAATWEEPLADHELTRELLACAQMGYLKGVQRALDALAGEGLLQGSRLSRYRELASRMRLEELAVNIQEDAT